MSFDARLFSQENYPLGPATLQLLQPADSAFIGTTVASMEPWQTLGFAASHLQGYLGGVDPALNRYAVKSQEEIVGVVCVRHPWLRGPYLELLVVFPPAQGSGVGQAIIRWLEVESRRTSKNLWAVTSEFNHRARSFYNKAGFLEIATIPDLVAPGYNEILLRKTVRL